VQTVGIPIDVQSADRIAAAGQIQLDATVIDRLHSLLTRYAQWHQVDLAQRSSAKSNRQLDVLIKSLGSLIKMLDAINFRPLPMSKEFKFEDTTSLNVQTAFREAFVNHRRFKRELAALYTASIEIRKFNSTKGRHPNRYLPVLMNDLASIYTSAGGHSTRVSRGMSTTRQSKFIDFAWATMQLLPEKMRHSSSDALAIWWEAKGPRPNRRKPAKRQ
jgi:hypothetical protein